jgi:transposase-like protein
MINLGMSIFDLAFLELKREGKLNKKNTLSLMLDRAIKIRKKLDNIERTKKARETKLKKRNIKCPYCYSKDTYKTLSRPFHNNRCNTCGDYFKTGDLKKRYGN